MGHSSSNAHTDPHSHSHAAGLLFTDCLTYSNGNEDCNFKPDSNPDRYCDGHGNQNSHCNSHANRDSYPDADSYCNKDSNCNLDTDSDTN